MMWSVSAGTLAKFASGTPFMVSLQRFLYGSQSLIVMPVGPIVRINPHEVHCNDVAFVDEIFSSGGRKRDKPQHQINGSA